MAIDQSGSRLSQHPVDQLIRDLAQNGRAATAGKIGLIIERMATAPFDRRPGPVPPTDAAIPPKRRTSDSLPELLVVYSANRAIILSGYQVSDLSQTGIPEQARWLK